MALRDYKINEFSKPVSSMPDVPGAAGYTAAQVKEWFDSNSSVELKDSVNGVVDFLLSFTDGEEIKGIRLNEDNVVEVTKDGENYISTGYSKAYITQMLAEKVDKSDVLLKTNTEEFTPTGIYQPATKKYVDDKVVSAGAADMTQAVYDPTGRQTDIFAEIDKKFDKSGGTIAGNLFIKNGLGKFAASGNVVQVEAINTGSGEADRRILRIRNVRDEDVSSALKLVEEVDGSDTSFAIFGEHNLSTAGRWFLRTLGGTLTGNLEIQKSAPEFYMRHTGTGRYYHVLVSNDGNIYFRNATDANNRTAFYLQPETAGKLERIFRLQKVVDGNATYYNVFGEHNKPSGSYTGNDSSGERIVSVGGAGDVLLIRRSATCYFISANGYHPADGSTSTATFVDGVLTIKSNDDILNNSGVTYYYYVL